MRIAVAVVFAVHALANVLTVLALGYGAVAWGPFGLRAEYERRCAACR